MSETPEFLIVGAGAFGLNLAYQLHERGASVRVIERDRVAGATSRCGAGFIGLWGGGLVPQWGDEELALERYALDFYSTLHQERPSFSLRRAGMLILGIDQAGWDNYVQPIADCTGVPDAEILDSTAAAECGQIVDADHIVGGVFHQEPVQVVAGDAIRALGETLRERGVQIDERLAVTGLDVRGGRIAGVHTDQGSIESPNVVLTTAMWTNALLRGHASALPYAPMGALRITTESLGLPDTMPMIVVPQHEIWLREQAGALCWGCHYSGQHRDALLDRDPPERLSEMPMDGLRETERMGRELSGAVPALAQYREFSYVEGYPCYTPDTLPLVGPIREVDGLFVLTGDAEGGITHGPGLGRELARHIVGEPLGIDINRYRPDRFDDQTFTPRTIAEELRK